MRLRIGPALERILGQQYHAVVGNPPYITVKDRALNEIYRRRFGSCHRKYSLVAPFMERFFDLAIAGRGAQTGGLRRNDRVERFHEARVR